MQLTPLKQVCTPAWRAATRYEHSLLAATFLSRSDAESSSSNAGRRSTSVSIPAPRDEEKLAVARETYEPSANCTCEIPLIDGLGY